MKVVIDEMDVLQAHITPEGLALVDEEMQAEAASATSWVCIGIDESDGTELWAPAEAPESAAIRAPILTPGTPA